MSPGRPIRGGIPVIFPQFGGGALPQHGFARSSEWRLANGELRDNGQVRVTFHLCESPETLALWPYPFRLELDVLLDERTLTVSMAVHNTGDERFDFNAVLHSYFSVADIRRIAVHGLAGVTYIDSLREDQREVETHDALRFTGETDRIYVDAPHELCIDDECRHHVIHIAKANMPDVVVWNPWIAKSQRMPDFGDDEYLHMVCVETGNMAARRHLPAGETWQGETVFSS